MYLLIDFKQVYDRAQISDVVRNENLGSRMNWSTVFDYVQYIHEAADVWWKLEMKSQVVLGATEACEWEASPPPSRPTGRGRTSATNNLKMGRSSDLP